MGKICKYQEGEEIPEGAIYLNTIVETEYLANVGRNGDTSHAFWKKCFIVWHYFLVKKL